MYTFFKSSREELLTWKDKSIIQLKHKILHTTFINSKPSGKDWFYNVNYQQWIYFSTFDFKMTTYSLNNTFQHNYRKKPIKLALTDVS